MLLNIANRTVFDSGLLISDAASVIGSLRFEGKCRLHAPWNLEDEGDTFSRSDGYRLRSH